MKTVAVILFAVLVLAVFWRRIFPGTSKRHRRRMAQAGNVRDLLSSGSLLPAQAFAYLRKVNPYSFEELVLDGFEKAGYKVKRNARYSGDGGLDGRVSKDGEEYLVQCKRYRGYISRQDVEDFSRVCTRECRRGFFVHTGKTGEGSRETAGAFGNVNIISGGRMLSLVGYVEPSSVVDDE